MALWIGWPLLLSHTTVVSRWLVMPMPAMRAGSTPAWLITSVMVTSTLVMISRGLCSTQPGCGNTCGNSRCAVPTMWPSWSNRMARELVVPWSIARM